MFTFQSFFEWAIANEQINTYEDMEEGRVNEYEYMEEGHIDTDYEELQDYVRLIEWCV